MAFKDEFDNTQKEMGGGEYFKFKEGDNKIRILSEPVKKVSRFGFGICYGGAAYCQAEALDADWEKKKAEAVAAGKDPEKVARPSLGIKWAVWVINRATGGVEIADLPNSITKQLRTYMDSDEYGFKDWPMPYDLTINAVGAGKKEVEYTVTPARANTELTAEELEAFAKATPMAQIIEKMKAKKREEDGVPAPEGSAPAPSGDGIQYPDDEINPEDIPF